jgi:hypothetical protein
LASSANSAAAFCWLYVSSIRFLLHDMTAIVGFASELAIALPIFVHQYSVQMKTFHGHERLAHAGRLKPSISPAGRFTLMAGRRAPARTNAPHSASESFGLL